ncbi:MAG: hypothetical protein Q4A55_03480 [Aerococcus sp.]|nr:hypothetical protein [Aerococcus sp.]
MENKKERKDKKEPSVRERQFRLLRQQMERNKDVLIRLRDK